MMTVIILGQIIKKVRIDNMEFVCIILGFSSLLSGDIVHAVIFALIFFNID
jgi:hypothetical protein